MVAAFKVPETTFDPRSLLLELDDLLLLVSLAEQRHCSCVAVSWSQGNRWSTYWRYRLVSKERPESSVVDQLVSRVDISSYLSRAYSAFSQSEHSNLIRSALQDATYDGESSIGEKYLRLFSALESALLAYRRESRLEFSIEGDKERAKLAKDLRKFLGNHPLLVGDEAKQKQTRARVYENFPLLWRVSLSTAFRSLVKAKDIDLRDLWPLTDSADGISLTQIRNKIVHGEAFRDQQWESSLRASVSLRKTVQRVLFAQLGWDASGALAMWEGPDKWRAQREALSRD